jgi:uncharacterized RDD family membrane protein YckC
MDNLNEMNGNIAPADVQSVRYSGFWRRLCAFLLDGLLITLINAAFIVVLVIIEPYYDSLVVSPVVIISYSLIIVFLLFIYETIFLSSRRMATPGKQLLGIKVTDMDGNRISFSCAVLRGIIKFGLIFVGGIPTVIGCLTWLNLLNPFLIVFTMEKQAIHDHIAGTVVIQK